MVIVIVIRALAGIHRRRSSIGRRDPGREVYPALGAAHAAAIPSLSRGEACAGCSFGGGRWIAAVRRITTSTRRRLGSPGSTRKRREDAMTDHKVVGRQEWQAARDELLQREKQHTRMGDELARQRRELPWVEVDKEYHFDTEEGPRTLAELFDGRSQLLVYHFMFGPSYQAGDPVNSSIADTLDGLLPHLQARDVTPVLVSQAPLEKLRAYKRRMGWRLGWVSAANTDFNFDFGASATQELTPPGGLPPIVAQNAAAAGTDVLGYLSEAPVVSVFTLQDGGVYQTYATTWRGVEFLMGYYPILDRAPKGRDEGDAWQTWLRRHDEYNSQ
jgi:predicted dithiol-disulfide oxidoreductase (DUF899 family)